MAENMEVYPPLMSYYTITEILAFSGMWQRYWIDMKNTTSIRYIML